MGGFWSALLVANFRSSPAVPWSVPVMAFLLWLMNRVASLKAISRLAVVKFPGTTETKFVNSFLCSICI